MQAGERPKICPFVLILINAINRSRKYNQPTKNFGAITDGSTQASSYLTSKIDVYEQSIA